MDWEPVTKHQVIDELITKSNDMTAFLKDQLSLLSQIKVEKEFEDTEDKDRVNSFIEKNHNQ